MIRYSRFIIRHRKYVIAFFLILLPVSFLGIVHTEKNYDLLSYMPGDLNSRQGEELLEQEFGLSGLGLLVVSGKESREISSIKSRIEEVEGVEEVLWVDRFADIMVPVEFMNHNAKKMFYSDDGTMLQIRFEENSRTKKTLKAVEEIRSAVIGKGMLFGGQPVIMHDLQTTTSREMVYYMLIAAASIYIILSLSMTSFLEPLLFLVSAGIAIALNMGTNIVIGKVSFITASIAAVMQLGISMDYSIFLLHRFEDEKKKFPDAAHAMVSALSKTGTAIASSALTTAAGFVALMVMKNGIGQDLGFVLAKGIVLSLLVNMTVLPCLVLIFGKYADKHRHRPLIPSFERIADLIVKYRWILLVLIIVVSIPAFPAQRSLDYYYTTEHYLPESSKSVMDTEEIGQSFGASGSIYVIVPDRGRVREEELVKRIRQLNIVESVICLSEQVDMALPDTFIPHEINDAFVSEGYRYIQVSFSVRDDHPSAFKAVDVIREKAGELFSEYYVTGTAALARDMAALAQKDMGNVAVVSISLILLILAVSFMSVSIPFILVLVIELAVWINLSIPYFAGSAVSSMTSIVIGAIQLGATVDYAILFTSRYRENASNVKDRIEAVKKTIGDTGRSILTSALTMIAATMGIAVMASIKTTGELTLMIGRGAAISMTVIFLGLPAMLLIFDRVIESTTLKRLKCGKAGERSEAS